MPIPRETPYSAFNFLVELGDFGKGDEPKAGFSEISGLNAEVTVAEYRAGNAKVNYVNKFPGIHKAGDVTLKRGVIGEQNLYIWLEQCRNGDLKAKRNIEIKLQSEDRGSTVMIWKLMNAMPIKWTGPTLTAKGGGDVAIEELVLSVEMVTQG